MMNLVPEDRETIAAAATALRTGASSCTDVLNACIAQIERWERQVHAWAFLDLDGAREQARRLDAELAAGNDRGPLHGIPIGIKDVVDVAGMPTGCGSWLLRDRTAARDAWAVSRLRAAGAVVIGKTTTAPYAWIDPPATRNPWNLERTPGGSSSGSAAAVAAGMCLGAIGTQTGGSIIRPSSFCGTAGFKPTFNAVSTDGVFPCAPSLDHVGPIARSVADLTLLFQALHPREGEPAPVAAPPRIGLLGDPFWRRADASMHAAFAVAIDALRAAGAETVPAPVVFDFDRIIRSHRTILASEAAANHRDRLNRYPDDYPTEIQSLIEEGSVVPALNYIRAKQLQENGRDLDGKQIRDDYAELFRLLDEVDLAATPAALGSAPDLSTTGHPAFNSPWSFFGLPAVTFPVGLSPEGLPLGIQLIGSRSRDAETLDAAAWCERAVRSAAAGGGG